MKIINEECIKPKDIKNFEGMFWGSKLKEIQTPLKNDLYVGQGATQSTMLGHEYPYTIVEITGKLGNRIAKLVKCEIKKDGTFTNANYGFIYLKETNLKRKMNKGNSYNYPYKRNENTGRLRIMKWCFISTGSRDSYRNPEV